uniref:ubiquitin carboxyl-terminal hydrolase 5-like isoform X2 n=1 Tax=Myxine glutinosa TaxID=7769 RepID=UPI00358F787F
MADAAELVVSCLAMVRAPGAGDKVYKDECVYSFDTPESPSGLFVCLRTFLGFGRDHVDRFHSRTGQRVFLHIKRTRKPELVDGAEKEGDPPRKKPTRLAIGMEGGFDVDSTVVEYDEEVAVVIFPEQARLSLEQAESLASPTGPRLSQACRAVLAADSASRRQEVAAWDGEIRHVSRFADSLTQLDNGVRITPSGWKCSRCDLRENLWMNLTDGTILCGRQYFDGSGGNGHALDHYRETTYPLAVKLGTITPASADVFSYAEDDMVLDQNLAEHLAHFGINMMKMEKTDKTMTELEIAMNERVGEWETIQETGVQLVPLFGPSYTGLHNLGNSCYLNSVVQVLFSIPDFQKRYVGGHQRIIESSVPDPAQDFNIQVAKLGHGLLSGVYSKPPPNDAAGEQPEQMGIPPRMFKALVGKGHPEFSTNRQQDAQEFFLHLINLVERNCRGADNPTEAFRLLVEERTECVQSGRVRYTQRLDYIVQLPVPMDAAVNKAELAEYDERRRQAEAEGCPLPEPTRARIPFEACLSAFAEPESVEEFWSSALLAKSTAVKTTRFASFPEFLVLQVKKFTFGLDWVPKKLDISIDMPNELDLSALRGGGLQPGELELPELAPPPLTTPEEPKGIPGFGSWDGHLISPSTFPSTPDLDEVVIGQLGEMGFPPEACRKAVYFTGNVGIEPALNWLMAHMDDPDFASPLLVTGSGATSPSAGSRTPQGPPPPEESISMIVSMGFTQEQAVKALRATNNNLERAADWIFSHADELDAEISMETSDPPSRTDSVAEATPVGPSVRDGAGKYQLFAFISHMGTSTMCGHYVCHIRKDGRWVIYNDQKVAASEKPPRDLGYMYFYQRLPS